VQRREFLKNAAAREALRANNIPEHQIDKFNALMSSPRIMLMKLWASFFMGSMAGAIVSGAYWFFS